MTQLNDKDKNKKAMRQGIIAISIAVLVTIGILYFRSSFAKESPIAKSSVTLNGKQLTAVLSEKKGSYGGRDADGMRRSGYIHYGYALELINDATQNSLAKYKFKSPIDPVSKHLDLVTLSSGIAWIVSQTPREYDEDHGYLLKFEIKDHQIAPLEFGLDKKYRVRKLKENKVILTEGEEMYSGPTDVRIYFDLETEKVIHTDKKGA